MRRGNVLRKRKWKGSKGEGWRKMGVQTYPVSSNTFTIMEYLNRKEKDKSSISMGV